MSKRFFTHDSTQQPFPKLVCMVSASDLSPPIRQTQEQCRNQIEPQLLGAQNPVGTVFLSPASLQEDLDPQDSRSSSATPLETSQTPSQSPLSDLLQEMLTATTTLDDTPERLPIDQAVSLNYTNSARRFSPPENSRCAVQRQQQEHISGTLPTVSSNTPNASPYRANNHFQQTSATNQVKPKKHKNICCLIDVLLKSQFTSLTCKQQKYVVLIGKPSLSDSSRSALDDISSNTWITECKGMKKYFCWPCLLYDPQNSEISKNSVHASHPNHKKNEAMLVELMRNKNASSYQTGTKSHRPSTSKSITIATPNSPIPNETCIISLIERNRCHTNWLTGQRRLDIIKNGRPCPTLKCARSPDTDLSDCSKLYSTISWLAGSKIKNKFYCWPCLLFAQNYLVMDPVAAVSSTARQHRLLKSHMWSTFLLKQSEKNIERPCQSNFLEMNGESEYFKRLIDVNCLVKTCSSDASLDSLTIVGLMGEVIRTDKALQRQSPQKPQSVHSVGMDLSACLQHVVNERIREEVGDAPYVALILEDVSDVVDKSFIATFICYVSKKGDVCERFLRFDCIAFDRSAKTILNLVTKVLAEFDIARKLVGITYGGTVLDPFQVKRFQKELRQVCPCANFFNFGGHDLKKIILQSLSHIPTLRYFIQSLDANFEAPHNFSQLFQHYNTDVLQEIMKDQGSQWFFMCLAANYKALVKLYDDLGSSDVAVSDQERWLFKSLNTQFLIVLLAKIFTRVIELMTAFDPTNRIANSQFILGLLTIEAEGYGAILDDAKKLMPVKTDESKPLDVAWFAETFETVLKCVSEVVMCRTDESDLTNLRRYISSIEIWRDNISKILRQSNFQFHIEKLMNQMDFVNRTHFFADKTPVGLIRSIVSFRMADSLSELVRFLRLVIVTSASDYDGESSSVKNMRILMKQNRSLFSNLSNAQVRIESSLLRDLQEEPSFYAKCFDCFKQILETRNTHPST